MPNKDIDSNTIKYKKKQIKDLLPGDIILHPIYRSDGLMLITKNKKLSSSLIKIIKKHTDLSMPVLVVSNEDTLNKSSEKNLSSTPAIKSDLEEVTNNYNNKTSFQTSIATFMQEDTLTLNKNTSDKLDNNILAKLLSNNPLWHSLGQKLESEQLRLRSDKVKNKLLNLIINDESIKKLFESLKAYDDILFIHTINTTCISLMVGLSLELDDNKLIDLAVSALFANIGFLDIPKKEFKKFLKTHTADHEPIRKHLEMFSKMTFNTPYLRKKSIVYGILDHHEYYNGKGYPNGKKGEEISLYGRVLHLAQTYDELVGGYKYTNGLSPIEALKLIYENKENRFDQDILNTFIHRTTYFKLGEIIILPKNLKGTIIGFDNYLRYPHLPIVKLESGKVLNLLKDFNEQA